jgi:hypothetical protein
VEREQVAASRFVSRSAFPLSSRDFLDRTAFRNVVVSPLDECLRAADGSEHSAREGHTPHIPFASQDDVAVVSSSEYEFGIFRNT